MRTRWGRVREGGGGGHLRWGHKLRRKRRLQRYHQKAALQHSSSPWERDLTLSCCIPTGLKVIEVSSAHRLTWWTSTVITDSIQQVLSDWGSKVRIAMIFAIGYQWVKSELWENFCICFRFYAFYEVYIKPIDSYIFWFHCMVNELHLISSSCSILPF